MKCRARVFNGFLGLSLLTLVLLLAGGCGTTEERARKKEKSDLRIHVESDTSSDHSSSITIIRDAPIRLNIDREPVLDERQVDGAVLLDQLGGYVVEIKFNRQGSWILERTTVLARGRHLAIFSNFGQTRWLAAPLITGKNSTGRLVFTPDCTRAEAERFVRGLNNLTQEMQKKENWPFKEPFDK